MSLVAAYSDSESENENDEQENNPSQIQAQKLEEKPSLNPYELSENSNQVENVVIEDGDDWEDNRVTLEPKLDQTAIFSQLPQPSNSNFTLAEEVEDEFIKRKPTRKDALYAKERALLEKEKEEGSINLTTTKDVNRNLLSLPKPMKKKGPVKITIPTLSEIGADSDSDGEDGKPANKAPSMQGEKASALFSMLPKPRHSVTVGENKNKVFYKEPNRVLMPYTLTKKKDSEKPTTGEEKQISHMVTDHKNSTSKMDMDESDGEDEGANISTGNFFSLGDNSERLQAETNVSGGQQSDKTTIITLKKDSDIRQPPKQSEKIVSSAITPTNETSKSKGKGNAFFAKLFKKKNDEKTNKNTETGSNTDCCHQNKKEFIQKFKNDSNVSGHSTQTSHSNVSNYEANTITEACGSRVTGSSSGNSNTNMVTAPYGCNSNVTAPYGDNTDVTAPYGQGPYSGGVTALYGGLKQSQKPETRQYGGDTAYYGGHTYQQLHSYPSNPAERNFFIYEHQNNPPQSSDLNLDYYNQPNADLPLEKEALMALQGRKRRNEDINIIDISADQLHGDKDEYLKNLTVESGYKSKKPKNQQPTGMAKRKHQITYLAFQAKEREFELRQSWADSRASKQQTQSRYGF